MREKSTKDSWNFSNQRLHLTFFAPFSEKEPLPNGGGSLPAESLAEFAPAGANKWKSVLSGGVYIGQNTLRGASVEFVRKQRTNYARSGARLFQTENQRSVFRLRACQKTF